MTIIDSGTQTVVEVASPYINSAPMDVDRPWGQPPASHHVFFFVDDTLRSQLISDTEEIIYASSHHAEYPLEIEPQLDLEFQVWDILSDEALLNFERDLG